MTFTDRIIPFYVRFIYGFGFISVLIGMISFGTNIVTMITVKGFYIPAWWIPVVAVGIIIGCICLGYYLEKYDILNRISSHSNQNANPELKQLCEDVKEIKGMLKN